MCVSEVQCESIGMLDGEYRDVGCIEWPSGSNRGDSSRLRASPSSPDSAFFSSCCGPGPRTATLSERREEAETGKEEPELRRIRLGDLELEGEDAW